MKKSRNFKSALVIAMLLSANTALNTLALNKDKRPAEIKPSLTDSQLETSMPSPLGAWQEIKDVKLTPLPDKPSQATISASKKNNRQQFPLGKNKKRIKAMLVYEDGRSFGLNDEIDLGYLLPPEGFGAWNPSENHVEIEEQSAKHDNPATRSIILGGINNDRRIRYSSNSTLTSYPYRTVGSLSSSGNTKNGGCTGVLVGPRHVLTAAHCLHDSNGNWYSPIYFNPGQTNSSATNGSHKMVARWARDHGIHKKYDYGLIVLEDSPTLASLGWMGISWWNNTNSYSNKYVYNKGYPLSNLDCKASPLNNDRCDGWMYGDAASLASNAATNNDLLHYDIDTQSGHSGSPIYRYSNGSPAVIAVHGYGASGSLLNHGARFRSSMYNDICSWMSQIGSDYATHPNCN